jgi:hypothetical protein
MKLKLNFLGYIPKTTKTTKTPKASTVFNKSINHTFFVIKFYLPLIAYLKDLYNNSFLIDTKRNTYL